MSSLYRKWFAYTLEILYWTAITIYDGIEIIETETLEPIVKDNLNLVESFAEIYATAIDTIEFDPQRETIEDIKKFASTVKEVIENIKSSVNLK